MTCSLSWRSLHAWLVPAGYSRRHREVPDRCATAPTRGPNRNAKENKELFHRRGAESAEALLLASAPPRSLRLCGVILPSDLATPGGSVASHSMRIKPRSHEAVPSIQKREIPSTQFEY